MKRLQDLLKRFMAREIGLEEMQRRFSVLLVEDSNLASRAAAWLDAGERDGRLSSAVCSSMKNVIVTYLASAAGGPDPHDSGIFDTLYDSRPDTSADQAVDGSASMDTAVRSDESPPAPEQHPEVRADEPTRLSTGVRREPHAALRIGSVISDRFVLISLLGSGGMGSVYMARDVLREEAQDRNPLVALKVLSEEFKKHPDSMIALQREARRAQSLAHPNVIRVHDFSRDGPHVYITMEHLEGQGLDVLVRTEYKDGLPMSEAWPIIEGVGRALEYGHEKRIVHSDVKPGNIFVCDNGDIKVLDFGISRPMQLAGTPAAEQTIFDPAHRLGGLTPAYAALEMWAQATPDPRDDIYALACVSYLLLTGKHPFGGKPATEALQAGLSPEKIDSISRSQWKTLQAGLAFKREDRIPNVTRFLSQLAPASLVRSRRRLALLVVLLIASIIAAFGVRQYGVAIEGRVLDTQSRMQGNRAPVPAERSDLTEDEQREIDSRLALANLYLGDITLDSSAEDIAYVLTYAPNSIKELYGKVLEDDPGNEAALQLRSAVVDLYTRKARSLFRGREFPDALDMVRLGEQIDSGNRGLYRLREQICAEDPEIC